MKEGPLGVALLFNQGVDFSVRTLAKAKHTQ